MSPLLVGSPPPPVKPRSRRVDLIVGIAAGVLLGIAVVAAFVFLGSEGTVDAPRITGVDTGKPPEPASVREAAPAPQPQAKPAPKPAPRPVPTVEVIGGAPPEATGPVRLRFRRGERIRFKVETTEPVAIEIPGYGVAETVESGSVVSFKATHTGQFPVIAAATYIGIAELWVTP